MRQKQGRVHDNLHLVLDLEEQVLEQHCCGVRRRRPHLLLRSGMVAFQRWSPDSLRAIVRERLAAVEAQDEEEREEAGEEEADEKKGGKPAGEDSPDKMPIETVAKLLSDLHEAETELDPFTVASSQFLDAVAIFPEFYRPLAREMKKKEEDYLAGIQVKGERRNGKHFNGFGLGPELEARRLSMISPGQSEPEKFRA